MNDCTSFDKEKYDKIRFFNYKFHNPIKKLPSTKYKKILRWKAKRTFSFKNHLRNYDMPGI